MIGIVGAGLAGLACARSLAAAGRPVTVFEASREAGGRVGSDRVGGFILDRGFQVILDSYPSIQGIAKELAPRYFDSGALLWDRGKFWRVRNPLRHPALAATCARDVMGGAFRTADVAGLISLVAASLIRSDRKLLERCGDANDLSVLERARQAGLSPECVERFIRPFFGGVLLDPALETSAALWTYYLKKFALGRAFVPSGGMGELPRRMVADLPQGTIRLGTPVARVSATPDAARIDLADGQSLDCEAAIVATDAKNAWNLLGLEGQPPPTRSVWTVSFSADESLHPDKLIVLPAGRHRLVRHFAQITNVAPEYSASARHLVVATILDPRGTQAAALANAARSEILEVFPQASLELIDIRRIRHAVRSQPPGFAARQPPSTGSHRVVLAGDYLASASIEGAMASGRRAAVAAGRL